MSIYKIINQSCSIGIFVYIYQRPLLPVTPQKPLLINGCMKQFLTQYDIYLYKPIKKDNSKA